MSSDLNNQELLFKFDSPYQFEKFIINSRIALNNDPTLIAYFEFLKCIAELLKTCQGDILSLHSSILSILETFEHAATQIDDLDADANVPEDADLCKGKYVAYDFF